jgi:cytoskeleton protein RodZ
MTEKASEIGRYLQNHRRDRSIPLEAVSRLTRISMSSLRHIENDAWDSLPAPVFVRGFLRAFAEAIGADPEEVLRRFDLGRQIKIEYERSRNQFQSSARLWVRIFLTVVCLAIVIGGTLYLSKWMARPGAGEGQATAPNGIEAPERQIEAAQAPATVSEAGAPEPSVAAPPKAPPQELTLTVSAVEITRLKVIADAHKPEQFDLKPGDELTLKAESRFSLLIDNAAGVRIAFNGEPVALRGKSGQPLTLQLP